MLIMKKHFTQLFAFLTFVFSAVPSMGQDGFTDFFFTTGASTDWFDLAAWSNLGTDPDLPDGDDYIIISHNMTIAGNNAEFGFLDINHDGTSAGTLITLTVAAGDSLIGIVDVYDGNVSVLGNGTTSRIAKLDVIGYLQCNGLSCTAGGLSGKAFVFIKSGGEVDLNGDWTFSAGTATSAQATLTSGSGNRLNISGAISGTGRFTGGTGANPHGSTVVFDGSAAQTIPLNTSMVTTFGDIEISNTVSATTDTSFEASNLFGYFTVNSGGNFTQGNYSHLYSDTVANAGTYTYENSIDFESSFTNTGTFTSSGGRIDIAGDWTNSGTYTYSNGDTVTFDGSTAQTITGSSTFSVLELSNTAASTVPTYDVTLASGSINVDSIFDINDCSVQNVAATITLTSNATRTAQMLDIGTGSYRGDMVVQRHLDCLTNDWRELISPVSNTDISQWQNDGVTMTNFPGSDFPSFGWTSVYWYDETAVTTAITEGWMTPDSTDLESDIDRGIRVFMGNNTFDLSVSGEPRTGNQQIPVTSGNPGSTDFGWNLVGNPYPCAVNWNLLEEADKNNIDNGIWAWNGLSGNYDFYQGNTSGAPGGELDSIIPSHKAFWVHAIGAAGYVDWNEHDKVTSENNFVKNTTVLPEDNIVVRMTSGMNTFKDAAILKWGRSSTENYDQNQDFLKMYSNMIDEVPSVCFVTEDNKDVCVNSIPHGTTSLPLKAFAGNLALGTYTLTFENLNAFAANACVVLEDMVLGTTHDLKSNPEYTYDVLAGDEAITRFIIHIEVQYELMAENASCQGLTDGSIEVEHNTQSSFAVTWSDDVGNVIGTDLSNSSNYMISDLAPGTYHVDISGNCVLDDMVVEILDPEPVVADFSLGGETFELNEVITIANNSTGSESYYWEMGDGTSYNGFAPTHFYSNPGTYSIELTSYNGSKDCYDNQKLQVEILQSSVGIEDAEDGVITAFVSNESINVINRESIFIERLQLTDMNGKLIKSQSVKGNGNTTMKMPALSSGIYMLKIVTTDSFKTVKLFVD